MRTLLRNIMISLGAMIMLAMAVPDTTAQRRVTPVTPTDPVTNPKRPETTKKIDRSRLAEITDAQGNIVLVDTVTGTEFIDSTEIKTVPKMQYPLWHAVVAGVNLWDPLMRAFGQKYGLFDVWAELSIHNRYKPIIELGLGTINDTPSGGNYTFKSPVAPYFKLGANYNFFYNSNPDYQLLGGLRLGFTHYNYEIPHFSLSGDYWDESSSLSIPKQSSTAAYLEIVFGIKVKIAGPISMGWNIKYHSILHESKAEYGQSMYIPGYGKRNSSITGGFSIMYTIPLNKTIVPVVESEKK